MAWAKLYEAVCTYVRTYDMISLYGISIMELLFRRFYPKHFPSNHVLLFKEQVGYAIRHLALLLLFMFSQFPLRASCTSADHYLQTQVFVFVRFFPSCCAAISFCVFFLTRQHLGTGETPFCSRTLNDEQTNLKLES